MVERGRLNVVLAIAAVAVLVGSGITLAVTSVPQGDLNVVIVNGFEYSWMNMNTTFTSYMVEADLKEDHVIFECVLITDLINASQIQNPSQHTYVVVGSDGYEVTFTWYQITHGYLAITEKRAIFPDVAARNWVRDVIEIRIVEG